MHFHVNRFVQVMTAYVLATIFAIPQSLFAQASVHVVTPAEMHKAAMDASRERQQNLDCVREFVSSEKARRALESAHMSPQQVKDAVANLNAAELAQLASKVQKTQADFAAGTISNRDLIFILLGIAALILIIVAVR